MQQPDPRLEEIKVLEDAVAIKTTKQYAGLGKFTFDKDAVQFRPTLVPYLIAFAIGGALLILPISGAISKGLPDNNRLPGMVMGILPGLLVLFISIRQFRAQKKATILINNVGITLDDALYNWDDIYETAVLEKPKSVYLVVVLKEKTSYRLYRLTDFRTFNLFFPITLSKYIEHFKKGADQKVEQQ